MMKIEIRSANEAVIEGYVNAVGRDSRIMRRKDGKRFVEVVEPRTFEKALGKGGNIEVRLNHGAVLGSTESGSLKLYEDNIGLYAKATITDADTIEKARRKELRGWSFGFVKIVDRWENTDEEVQRRYLEDIELREVSILDKTPAYIATSIEMRDEEGSMLETRFIEDEGEVRENTEGKMQKAKLKEEQRAESTASLSRKKKEIEILDLGGRKI